MKLKNTNFINIKVKINEIVVSNKFTLVNKVFNISLVTKIEKKLDLYVYSFQKWVYTTNILIGLNAYILR